MNLFLETVYRLLDLVYGFVFFRMLSGLLPLRPNRILRFAAYCVCTFIAATVIYPNDIHQLVGTLLGFSLYIFIFHQGRAMEKVSTLLVFYPALIAVNYLIMDSGTKLFFGITHAAAENIGTDPELQLISNLIYTFSMVFKLLLFICAWMILRRFLTGIANHLTARMWLIVDMLALASFVTIFIAIYFMENTFIVYPICIAALFSSFGCMYLASYVYRSVQTTYRAQELEARYSYYEERQKEEARVRSIYHDLKNHLLILQSQAENSRETQQMIGTLQSQMEGYENYLHTGNDFLDIIIRDKARMAQEKQIDFSAVIHFAEGAFLEPLDISTIFGNALDNAIEASEKLPVEQRLVTVKTARVRDMLIITVENNVEADSLPTGRTSKKDTFSHGFGIPNIEKAVEKYDGQCSSKSENNIFQLKIIIPIPD